MTPLTPVTFPGVLSVPLRRWKGGAGDSLSLGSEVPRRREVGGETRSLWGSLLLWESLLRVGRKDVLPSGSTFPVGTDEDGDGDILVNGPPPPPRVC